MNLRPLRWVRELLMILVWVLPLLVPYAAGLWWLAREGYLLFWMGGVLLLSLILMAVIRWIPERGHGVTLDPGDVDAAEAELRARDALQQVVATATAADLASGRALEALLRRVLAAVARAWHPDSSRAELRFTLPEALALTERVSSRLRTIIHKDLPTLEHMQLSHVVVLQQGVKPARRLWNVYRVGRFAFNPAGSVLGEIRRTFMKSVAPLLMDSVKARAAGILARETGEAAILLYSGQLRRDPDTIASDSPEPEPAPDTGPLTLLVTGQPNSGKSSLINALSGGQRALTGALPREQDYTPYALEEETAGDLLCVDGPGLKGTPDADWFREADRADIILWVAAAHRADRAADQTALRALRAHQARHSGRRVAPVLLVLTHVDRLDPAAEWDPPYDVEQGQGPKEQNIRAASRAAASALEISPSRTVPVKVNLSEHAWNLENFWLCLHQHLPAARQTRLERLLTRRSRLEGLTGTVKTLPGLLRRAKDLAKS